MKNILIFVMLLVAFSVTSQSVKNVERKTNFVNGLQSEGEDVPNQSDLDAKADTADLLNADSLGVVFTSNFDSIAATRSVSLDNNFRSINNTFNDSICGETLLFEMKDANVSVALADGTQKLCGVLNMISDTIIGVEFYIHTSGDFTGDNTNSISLYSISNGIATKELETINSETIFELSTGIHRVYFSTEKYLEYGIYGVGILPNWSAVSTAPKLLGMNITSGQALFDRDMYIFNGVDMNTFTNSKTSAPETITISTSTGSTSLPYFRLIHK